MKKSISITLDETLLNALKLEASALGVSISNLIELKLSSSPAPSPFNLEDIAQVIKDTIQDTFKHPSPIQTLETIPQPKSPMIKPWEV